MYFLGNHQIYSIFEEMSNIIKYFTQKHVALMFLVRHKSLLMSLQIWHLGIQQVEWNEEM